MKKTLVMLPIVLTLIACGEDQNDKFNRAVEGALKHAETDEQRESIQKLKQYGSNLSDAERDQVIESWENFEKADANLKKLKGE